MNLTSKKWVRLAVLVVGIIGIIGMIGAQIQRQHSLAAAATRQVEGKIGKIDAKSVMLKSDAGVNITAVLQDSTRIVRLEPGQLAPGETDLTNATPIQLNDLQVGDRVQIRGRLLDDAGSVSATTIVMMNRSDDEAK